MRPRSRRRFLKYSLALAGASLLTACGLERLSVSRPMLQRRIAYLSNPLPSDAGRSVFMDVFREAMRDRGFAEGQNLVIEELYAGADVQASEFSALIERFQPEVIVVPAATVARPVRAITATIPVVSIGQGGDLVTSGLVESLARPGGNITGLSLPLLAGKPLQLLKETLPGLQRVALLFDATIVSLVRPPYKQAATDLGLEVQFQPVSGPAEMGSAVQAAVRERAGALYVLSGPVFGTISSQERIGELASRFRLPSMWQLADAVTRGADGLRTQ